MPTFTPPTVSDRPQVSEDLQTKNSNPLGYRLMRFYQQRLRGVNVWKMSDGTYLRDDRDAEPYPSSPPFPRNQSAEPSFPNGNLAQSYYNSQRTDYPVAEPHVLFFYLGGHSYTVSTAEAALLTTAGFGANIT